MVLTLLYSNRLPIDRSHFSSPVLCAVDVPAYASLHSVYGEDSQKQREKIADSDSKPQILMTSVRNRSQFSRSIIGPSERPMTD